MSPVTYEWDIPNMIASCHRCEWIVSYIWMNHGTHMNQSCHTCDMTDHTCKWGMSRINESWHTCEWVISHVWMSHAMHASDSRHTHERVIVLNELYQLLIDLLLAHTHTHTYTHTHAHTYTHTHTHTHTHARPNTCTHAYMNSHTHAVDARVFHTRETWLIHVCDTRWVYTWHDSCICVARLILHINSGQSQKKTLACRYSLLIEGG